MFDGHKKWLWLAGAFLLGVAASGKVRSFPLGSRIPTF